MVLCFSGDPVLSFYDDGGIILNVLSSRQQKQILTLMGRGYCCREVSRRLDVRTETVSKYAKEAGWTFPYKGAYSKPVFSGVPKTNPQKKAPRPCGVPSLCEPYRKQITEQVKLRIPATEIHRNLACHHGFEHSYDSVKVFVRKLKRQKK